MMMCLFKVPSDDLALLVSGAVLASLDAQVKRGQPASQESRVSAGYQAAPDALEQLDLQVRQEDLDVMEDPEDPEQRGRLDSLEDQGAGGSSGPRAQEALTVRI